MRSTALLLDPRIDFEIAGIKESYAEAPSKVIVTRQERKIVLFRSGCNP